MGQQIKFELKDNSKEVSKKLRKAMVAFLHEAIGEIEASVARLSRVDTGKTKGSWKTVVNEAKFEAIIGTNDENAIWEEFGTGEHALKGDGRKTPWYVPVDTYHGKKKPTFNGKVVVVTGKSGKKFYKTNGKQPNRTLQRAYEKKKAAIIRRAGQLGAEMKE